jgi:glycosyltransferase involved in cell wall biosynthesis
MPELNVNGKTGFMSNVGDVEDMAKNALFILQDENLPTFKKNALMRAKEFDIANIVPRYLEFYEKILSKFKKK